MGTMTKMDRNETIAYEIADFLSRHKLGEDVETYFNGKVLRFVDDENFELVMDGDEPWCVLGSEFTEYANDETVTMTFEGDFYLVVNGFVDSALLAEFDAILESYGMYYEQGYSWDLSLHEG